MNKTPIKKIPNVDEMRAGKCWRCGRKIGVDVAEEEALKVGNAHVCLEHIRNGEFLTLHNIIPPHEDATRQLVRALYDKTQIEKYNYALRRENTALNYQVSTLVQKAQAKEEADKIFSAYKEEADKTISAYKGEIDSLNQQVLKLSGKNSELTSALEKLGRENSELRGRMDSIAPMLQALSDAVEKLESTTVQLEDKTSQNTSEIARLNQNVEQVQAAIEGKLLPSILAKIGEVGEALERQQEVTKAAISVQTEVIKASLNTINDLLASRFSNLAGKIDEVSNRVWGLSIGLDTPDKKFEESMPKHVEKPIESRRTKVTNPTPEPKNMIVETLPESFRIVYSHLADHPNITAAEIVEAMGPHDIGGSNIRNKILPRLHEKGLIVKSDSIPATYKVAGVSKANS